MKCSLTASPAIYRLFTLSPIRKSCGQRLPGISIVRAMRILCCSSAIEEVSANSPCAPTVRGKRGQNKALSGSSSAYFSTGRGCSDRRCPPLPHPVSIIRRAFIINAIIVWSRESIALNHKSGKHSEFRHQYIAHINARMVYNGDSDEWAADLMMPHAPSQPRFWQSDSNDDR